MKKVVNIINYIVIGFIHLYRGHILNVLVNQTVSNRHCHLFKQGKETSMFDSALKGGFVKDVYFPCFWNILFSFHIRKDAWSRYFRGSELKFSSSTITECFHRTKCNMSFYKLSKKVLEQRNATSMFLFLINIGLHQNFEKRQSNFGTELAVS